MPFTDEEIFRLMSLLQDAEGVPQAVAQTHCLFPDKTVTRCDASDMGTDVPYRPFPGFDLYLVDGRNHCWRITGEPAEATGIVLARRSVKASLSQAATSF